MATDSLPGGLLEVQRFLADSLRRDAPIADDPVLAAATRAHVAGNDRLSPAEQADIYREQFWLRHVEALTEDYPGLRVVMGEEAFDALLRAYLHAHPPRTPSLRDLGADLVPFAEAWPGFPPERRVLALDMLRYEHAFIDLFDGADVPPLDARKLAALGEGADRARIVLHPLLALLRLGYPVHHYRLAIVGLDTPMGAETPASVDPTNAGAAPSTAAPPLPEPRSLCLALYREGRSIKYEEAEPEAFALLEALRAGEPLGAACDRVAAGMDEAAAEAFGGKVGAWFQRWTALGWIVDVAV